MIEVQHDAYQAEHAGIPLLSERGVLAERKAEREGMFARRKEQCKKHRHSTRRYSRHAKPERE